MYGLLKRYVGCVTVVADTATVEEIELNNASFYRLTLSSDAGMSQSTWANDATPEVVFRLLWRLEKQGSHVRASDGMLIGPHLMRGDRNREIVQLVGPEGGEREFELTLDPEVAIDLDWLSHILDVTKDLEEMD